MPVVEVVVGQRHAEFLQHAPIVDPARLAEERPGGGRQQLCAPRPG